MDMETLHNYCLGKPGTTDGFPFGEDTLVFKAGNKIYALADLANGDRVNLKCDPELAVELRERYEEVQPGYHMNKTHWNTVFLNGSLTQKQLFEMIDHSYQLIIASLPKKIQAEIKALS
ncbi:MmcQ/YjbR family DNA-binding protein [Mucilaginibacter koreensis]